IDDELRYEILYEDTLCVIASQLHPLAHRKRIRYSELSAERWPLPAEGTLFSEHIQRLLQVGGLSMPSHSLQTIFITVMSWLVPDAHILDYPGRPQVPFQP